MDLSRRSFLKRCGQLAVLTAAGRIGLDVFAPLGQSARASTLAARALAGGGTLPVGTPILVLIDLQGGNDAVNMLINPNDPWYYDTVQGHGNIAVGESAILPLSGSPLGLHTSLAWTANRWHSVGDLAFVEGSGENVVNEFSHFAAMNYRNLADFSGSETRGWLGRYNDLAAPGSPFASVSLNGVHPALIGEVTPVLTVTDVASFAFDVDWRWLPGFLGPWQSMGSGGSVDGTMLAAAQQNIADTFAAQQTVFQADNTTYNSQFSSPLGQQMAQAAMLIQAGFASQTYVATFSGFDTHGSEDYQQTDLFTQLDSALGSFFALIDAGPRAGDVFVLVTSEFGRQQTANASAGSDHGQAGVNVLLGGGVAGGIYGQAPLTDPAHRLDDALIPTVDFRSVYATVLNRLSGESNMTAGILKANFADLGIFSSSAPPPPTTTTTSVATTTTTSTTRPTTTTTTKPRPTTTTTTKPRPTTTTTVKRRPTTTTTVKPRPTTTTTIKRK